MTHIGQSSLDGVGVYVSAEFGSAVHFPKWLGVGLLVLTVCLGISLIVHAIFQGGLYCKWFF